MKTPETTNRRNHDSKIKNQNFYAIKTKAQNCTKERESGREKSKPRKKF